MVFEEFAASCSPGLRNGEKFGSENVIYRQLAGWSCWFRLLWAFLQDEYPSQRSMSLSQAVRNPVLLYWKRLIVASTFEIISGHLHQMLWLSAVMLNAHGQKFIFPLPEITKKYKKSEAH